MSAILSVKNLEKSYDGKPVLSNITLEVKEREFVSVIGPNGSGKSTLLKMAAGVREPSAGTIEGYGERAYMPQDHALLPWRTVEENLLLPGQIQKPVRSDLTLRASVLLREFRLEEYAHFYPMALSGGTSQKVALLRTFLYDYRLLLLDEPFAALDAITRLKMQEWLTSILEKRGTSALCVTHDVREAIFLSDTIYVLSSRPGRIKEKFEVRLPRPRHHELLRMPEALELEKNLFSLLVQ